MRQQCVQRAAHLGHFLGDAQLAEEEGAREKRGKHRRLITLMTQPRSSWHFVEDEEESLLRFLDAETMEDVRGPVIAGTLERKSGAQGRGKICTEEDKDGRCMLFVVDGGEQGRTLW